MKDIILVKDYSFDINILQNIINIYQTITIDFRKESEFNNNKNYLDNYLKSIDLDNKMIILCIGFDKSYYYQSIIDIFRYIYILSSNDILIVMPWTFTKKEKETISVYLKSVGMYNQFNFVPVLNEMINQQILNDYGMFRFQKEFLELYSGGN